MEYRVQDLILLFFVYAFLGWCGEVAFAACKNGRFVNRGFLNGPICPIYGFGVLIVALALRPWEDNLAMLYFGSAVLTTLLELVTGWALEKLFHTRWWNYSRMPLNIGGYVCLPFSFLWGAACVVILKWIHAPLFALVGRVPRLPGWILSGILCAAFVADLVVTLVSIHKLSVRLTHLSAVAKEMRAISDEMGETIAEHTLAAREKVETQREQAERRYAATRERVEAGRERAEAAYEASRERVEALQETARERAEALQEAGRRRVEALREANRERVESLQETTRERAEASRAELERRLAELRARRDALLSETHFGQRRLLDAFPNMRSLQHGEALNHLKESLRAHRSRGKR